MSRIRVRVLPVQDDNPVKLNRRCKRKCIMVDGQTVGPNWVKKNCTGCSMHTWYLKNVGEYK